jgi:hypothetical protein
MRNSDCAAHQLLLGSSDEGRGRVHMNLESEMCVHILTLRYCLLMHNYAVFNFAVLHVLFHFTPGYVVNVLPCILFGDK